MIKVNSDGSVIYTVNGTIIGCVKPHYTAVEREVSTLCTREATCKAIVAFKQA